MSKKEIVALKKESIDALNEWIDFCTRSGKISRNTIAVGLVVLHHLKEKTIVDKNEVVSQGGEIKGARSGLANILKFYGIPSSYLKEITTRQAHQDGQRLFERFEWGNKISSLSEKNRKGLFKDMSSVLHHHATSWLKRQSLKLQMDRRQAPTSWIKLIIESAKQISGGLVEQHLIGAKLERRFKNIRIPNYPAHAGDAQTLREGDYVVSKLVYHVTAAPSRNVIQKCKSNIKAGLCPILIVPGEQENKALAAAQYEGIDKELVVLSIEGFVLTNIIELAMEENKEFITILKEIIQVYNRRLSEVETDLSLQIQII